MDTQEQMEKKERRDGQAFGVISLVCGFLSLLLFCTCLNIPLAIVSVMFGVMQIAARRDKLLAAFGIALSCASLILMLTALIVFSGIHINMGSLTPDGIDSGRDSYEEYFEQYFNNLEDGSF